MKFIDKKKSFETTFQRGIYTNGNELSYDYIKLARNTDNLTFDERFLNPGFVPKWHETPFKEISFADIKDKWNGKEDYDSDYLQEPFMKMELKTYASLLLDAVVDYFVNNWCDKPKIVFHSGGYDSRIMSLALKRIYDKYGREFIGKLHFRCHQPECELFNKIMEIEGWPKEYYSCYDGPVNDYYDVGRADKPLNGWQNFNQTMNFWGDIIPKEEEKNWVVIVGLGGEMFKYIASHKTILHKYCENFNLNLLIGYNPGQGEWESMWMRDFADLLMPFWGYEYLYLSLRANPAFCQWNGDYDTVRRKIVENSNINLLDIPHGKHSYSWNISDKRRKEMMQFFESSLFFDQYRHKLGIKIDPFTNMYGFDAKLWGFSTVYEQIFK